MLSVSSLNLAISMSSGNGLTFDNDIGTKGGHAQRSNQEPIKELPGSTHRLLDQRVTSVYGDLRALVNQINACWTRNERLGYSEFQSIWGSSLHRLLALRNSLDDPGSECFRLGLLAFLTTVTFRVPKKHPATPVKLSSSLICPVATELHAAASHLYSLDLPSLRFGCSRWVL